MKSVRVMTLGLGCLTAVVGCARDPALVPAAGAKVVSDRPDVAVDAESGVRLYVKGNAWSADPSDLERVMTPILVTVENRSGRPIRVQYAAFKVTGTSGLVYEPIPPFRIERPGPVRTEPVNPPLIYDTFWVSPYLSPYWPGLRPWPYGFPFDATSYGRLYLRWREPLPTEEMIRDALPEGVLQPGGQVSGFLYFDKLTEREPRATLTARFAAAEQVMARQPTAVPPPGAQPRPPAQPETPAAPQQAPGAQQPQPPSARQSPAAPQPPPGPPAVQPPPQQPQNIVASISIPLRVVND